jgi:site-specific DNA-methyltransferase (adenine-specific)
MRPYYKDDYATIYNGDCLEITEWTLADVMLSDVPYGMSYRSGWTGSTIANDGTVDVRDRAISLWGDRPAIVFGRWSEPRPVGTRMVLLWDKGDWPGMGDLSLPWGPSTEEIYVIGYGWVGKRRGQILRDPKRPSNTSLHPTEKPVGLMEMLVRSCPPGIIADPFMGSGSTLVAARNLGRKSIGVELREDYCEIAAKRLSQQTLFA